MELKKIVDYTVYTNPVKKYYWVRLGLEESREECQDIQCENMSEITCLVDLLRNESNTFWDTEKEHIIIGREPTGENDPSVN